MWLFRYSRTWWLRYMVIYISVNLGRFHPQKTSIQSDRRYDVSFEERLPLDGESTQIWATSCIRDLWMSASDQNVWIPSCAARWVRYLTLKGRPAPLVCTSCGGLWSGFYITSFQIQHGSSFLCGFVNSLLVGCVRDSVHNWMHWSSGRRVILIWRLAMMPGRMCNSGSVWFCGRHSLLY